MFQAIIFDMDGVLFETEDFYYQRRFDFLQSKGINLDHLDPLVFVGARASQIWPLILGDDIENWNIDQLEKEYADYKLAHPTPYGQCVFPETKNVLSVLKERGLSLAVASNTDLSEVNRALTEAGILSYFDVIFSAMDCIACKPHPAVYEKAWTALGTGKSETLVIEDSQLGIAAGAAAGLEVWAIEDKKWGVDQSQAQRKIQSLADLLENLNNRQV